VQKFAQSLLEVADNLESAAKAVPSNIVQQGADVPAETALKYLRSLLEGVQATERVLLKVRHCSSIFAVQAQGERAARCSRH
jgi:molecular chaperone GrpE (heat shock protein)